MVWRCFAYLCLVLVTLWGFVTLAVLDPSPYEVSSELGLRGGSEM